MVFGAPPPVGSDLPLGTGISIIVPTYQEVDNIPHLLKRLEVFRAQYDAPVEVLFMDDDSQDGSVEAVAAAGHDWARIITRTENRGLSQAVIEGFTQAKYPVLACMDCDLSHPPEALPQMVLGLRAGQQMVIGSRYVPGGSTDDDWGIGRWLNSLVATLLARPLTKVRDPMSGFFVLRKSDFEAADWLSPVGYKIALELIVKCGLENVGEVPIHFTDRVHGESKLTFKEQLKYIQHLRRLYLYKFSNMMYLAQFLVVGMSGVVVNLSVLSVLSVMGLPDWICLAGGIAVSIVTNFLLNRRFTFSYARDGAILRQFVSFVGACAFGMVVNYVVALTVRNNLGDDGTFTLQLAALAGIAAGMAFNFLGSRYLVFRKRFVKKP
ncbi:dolichol-phosphate mannosyltransferase [Cognatiyoonia koreensis]|uniref:Dolichol-phosphate mannosyltransferase n=1 Tax=Cognatiyoonia koreensis TaxID=364200 RepID=A0A1I0RTC1_9RHOB|nr:glycosyltransferase family 2 protein [Cognatiyoonia koreensis]SEW44494.1 dolichol-phosphate mannosyltransferase [Cognatiyoonia koreensis]